MSEFTDFCDEYLGKYISDFNDPKLDFTEKMHFIFMRSKYYDKDRIAQIQLHPDSKTLIDFALRKHSPEMYLICMLMFPHKINGSSKKIVGVHGATISAEETLYKLYDVDSQNQLQELDKFNEYYKSFNFEK